MTNTESTAGMPFSVSVVVPVHNSEGSLTSLVDRLQQVLPSVASAFEIILVNDGSHDHSWQVIVDLVSKYSTVQGIDLMRNYGQHNALLCGIRESKHDVIVTMDDDLQHPPEEIPKLLEKLADNYDVVYGIVHYEQHNLWRTLSSQVTKITLQRAMGVETARNVGPFRAFRSQVRDAFANYQDPFVCIDVILTWSTARFAAVPVRHDPRRIGVSNYTFRKLVIHTLNMMTGFSVLPLQIASMMGFVLTLFGLGVLVYVVGRYLIEGGSVPGFPFLASTIAIFSGAQLFALGIIGEYLSRMHFRMMQKPTYAVREHLVTQEE